ncbi:MAG: photosystem reaction center subunit H, partial [Methylocystis sp.]
WESRLHRNYGSSPYWEDTTTSSMSRDR